MLIYVDDIIITGNNNVVIDTVIKQLNATFAINDLGQLSYFLGIEIVIRVVTLFFPSRSTFLSFYRKSIYPNQNPPPFP